MSRIMSVTTFNPNLEEKAETNNHSSVIHAAVEIQMAYAAGPQETRLSVSGLGRGRGEESFLEETFALKDE